MDADWLFINTNGTSAQVLAWATQAREILEVATTAPNPRFNDEYRASTCALAGVSALAVRTDDAAALYDIGVDLLVRETAEPLDAEIAYLQAHQPPSTVVLWDTPSLTAAYRHGLSDAGLDVSARGRAIMETANHIRRSALEQAMFVQLFSPRGTGRNDQDSDFALYGVNVVTPGWAALQAVAQFAESRQLADAGAIHEDGVKLDFRRAAATVTRAFAHFPDETTEVFQQFAANGRRPTDAFVSVWGIFVREMVDSFLAHAWENRLQLRGLGRGQVGEYVQTRGALRTLAQITGLELGGRPHHRDSGRTH